MTELRISEKVCCKERKETLNKLSNQGTSVVEGVFEWIKWTKSKRICEERKKFWADSLNAMDEATKDTYLKNTSLSNNNLHYKID